MLRPHRVARLFASASGAAGSAGFAHELEGVVAKRRASLYRPGERGWVKIKNREYWRYELEREGAIRTPNGAIMRSSDQLH